MKSTAEIKYDDIIIADEHLSGRDHDLCKNALWSIYNVIKKAKKVSTEYWTWEYTKLSTLYAMGKQALFLDENMKTLVLYEGDVKVQSTDKKDLTKSGFTISKKDGKTAFSYKLDDFNNVIFGLKLFVDVCEKYAAGGFAEQIFHYGDISIAFKDADIQAKEKEVQQVIAYDIGIRGTLSEEKFDVISEDDKAFIFAYDNALSALGYDFTALTNYTPRKFGWNEDETAENGRGYTLCVTMPEDFTPKNNSVEILHMEADEYAVIRVTDPFADPAARIGGGWQKVFEYVQNSEYKTLSWENRYVFEEIIEIDGVMYMDVRVPIK